MDAGVSITIMFGSLIVWIVRSNNRSFLDDFRFFFFGIVFGVGLISLIEALTKGK